MADTPTDAPTPAPAEASVTPEQNTNPEPAQAPVQPAVDLGLTPEQAEKFKTFISNSGGFDNAFKKLKTDISQPKPVENPVENSQLESQKMEEPTSHTQAQPVEPPKPPKGAITQDELMAQYYFETLSKKAEYSGIAKEIANGDVLKEMSKLGIPFRNQDGSWNNDKINDYLDLRAKTVPAKPTESTPDASAAPTVTYTEVGEGGVSSIEQAYKILMEAGSPHRAKAEEYIKNFYNKK